MDPDLRDDRRLVEEINRGETAAFDALYHRHRDWVVRLAFRFTRNHDDALDVLQETFTYLLGKFPGFQLTSRLTTFLYPVVRNSSVNLLRAKGRFLADDAILDTLPGAAPGDAASERVELASVVSGLPASQREVLLMRFIDDMSTAEIAQALDIPLGTVKSRLHNALAFLRADPRTRDYFLE